MRHRERPGRKSLLASALVHLVAFGLAWFLQASAPALDEYVTYEINIVSPPPAQEAETPAPVQEEELVVETPDPTPPPEEPEPDPVVDEPTREESRPEPTPTPPPPDPEPEEAGDPDPSDTESGEDINVRMEGLRRDFPAYYGNIITQMNRCMRFNGPGGLKTSVHFVIDRDGTVDAGRIEFVSRSGNAGFDFAVMEAVECAGSGRFGPLPEDLGLDRLPIIFELSSSRRGPEASPAVHPWTP